MPSGKMRRRQPQQSGMQKAVGALRGALPGGGGKSSTRTRGDGKGRKGGKAGGLTLMTAAAGFAFKNRNKISSMLRRDRSQPSTASGARP